MGLSARQPGPRARVSLTFIDQVVSSTSNFATGVAIARMSGAAQFGRYMLGLMVWLVIVGVHRRIISEPMIVTNGDANAESPLIAAGLSAEILFGCAASTAVFGVGLVAMWTGGSALGGILLAFAPWFIPLLIQDYWRAISFQRQRPDLALMNDITFAAVQFLTIVAFWALGLRSATSVIAAWGIGATVGAALGFTWFPVVRSLGAGLEFVRRFWSLGRWLLADFVTAFASQQAYIAFAAALLSKVDYGGFRAATSLMGPATVILLAAGNIGLPEVSRRVDSAEPRALSRIVRRLTVATMVCVGTYGLAIALAAEPMLRSLYGPEFARFGPLALLAALHLFLMVTAYGQGIALKATGWIRHLWYVRIGIAMVSVTTLIMFVRWFGVTGAGWAGVATGAYDAVALYAIYYGHRRRLRRGQESLPLVATATPASAGAMPMEGVVATP